MKLTPADVAFWNAKKAPAWMKALEDRKRFPMGRQVPASELIDACINFRIPVGTWAVHRSPFEASNLLNVLKIVRKRGSLIPELRKIAATGSHVAGSTKRRRSYAIKWYRRVMLERVNQWLRGFVGNEKERDILIASVENLLNLDELAARGMTVDRNSDPMQMIRLSSLGFPMVGKDA